MELIRTAYGKYGADKYRQCHLYRLTSGKGLIIKDNNGHQWSKILKKHYKSFTTALRVFNLSVEKESIQTKTA